MPCATTDARGIKQQCVQLSAQQVVLCTSHALCCILFKKGIDANESCLEREMPLQGAEKPPRRASPSRLLPAALCLQLPSSLAPVGCHPAADLAVAAHVCGISAELRCGVHNADAVLLAAHPGTDHAVPTNQLSAVHRPGQYSERVRTARISIGHTPKCHRSHAHPNAHLMSAIPAIRCV